VFEQVEHSDALEAAVRKEAQRLERFHDRITSARVAIARPQHRHHIPIAFASMRQSRRIAT
jgi:ribosome-associated translation inhibitor RaiA